MVRWRVDLVGHEFDLMDLPRVFINRPVRVVQGGGEYFLEADELEGLTTAEAVRSAAQKIVDHMNGAMKLRSPDYQNVRLGHVYEIRSDGSRAIHVVIEDAISLRDKAMPITPLQGGKPVKPPPEPAVGWRATAVGDSDVAEALETWANQPHDWANLYKVCEIIESRVDLAQTGVSQRQLSLFKHSANHQSAVGRGARHARLRTKPPPRPMTLDQAERVIGGLVRAWLETLT